MRKNKTFFESIYWAAVGIGTAVKTERNVKNYLIQLTSFLLVNLFIFKLESWQTITQFMSGVAVIAMEFMNTSVERLCDVVTKEKNEEIKDIKDIAAGAVLTWGLLYYGLEITYIIMKFTK